MRTIRILRNSDVQQALSMADLMGALRNLYAEMGTGLSVATPRTDVHHPMTRTDPEDAADDFVGRAHYLKTMVGGYVGGDLMTVRLSSDVLRFTLRDGMLRREKQAIAPGNWFGMVAVFSLETGELRALIQDGWVQRMRVGATSAIGDDYLARPDIRTVAILGSGGQARAHLRALSLVREFESARVWSPDIDHRTAFAQEMSAELQRDVVPCDSPAATVDKCDLLMTATNSRQPFVGSEWLREGMHVSTLHRDEVTDAGYRVLDRIILHTHEKEITVSSVALPKWNGTVLQDHPLKSDLSWEAWPTLAEVAAGKAQGRRSDSEITGFINNLGLGAQFAAAASVILREAESRGLGQEIDGDSIYQNMHS